MFVRSVRALFYSKQVKKVDLAAILHTVKIKFKFLARTEEQLCHFVPLWFVVWKSPFETTNTPARCILFHVEESPFQNSNKTAVDSRKGTTIDATPFISSFKLIRRPRKHSL
jgi:hypothetical protein